MKNNTNEIAYRMPVGVAKAYLKNRHGDENKMIAERVITKHASERISKAAFNLCLKGNCVKVIID